MVRFFSLIFVVLLFFGCESNEVLDVDKTPPDRPVMIPHLGDTGDPNSASLTENNNGIDAEPGEVDAIKIAWEPLTDTDLDYLTVHRFSNDNSEPIKIDSISITIGTPPESYVDFFEDNEIEPIGVEWFYFIHSVDRAGNVSISDTTSYRLAEKSIPIYPSSGQTFSAGETFDFRWSLGGDIQHCRIIVFNENNAIAWLPSADWYYTENEEPRTVFDGSLPAGVYRWRVDSFGGSGSGSESIEVQFQIQ